MTMWTIEQFRLAVILGTIGFIALIAIACIVAEKIKKVSNR